ncbi:Transposase IS66 family protein [Rhizobium lusitanum]|uniref:Transposase IS66 family protein n=1 Tax=Rhizobium lusitanum TaxID=293958 RepID=A0A1C3XBD9_9HYPH|nr:Transposase IS66 family protein [Rhizobium lusitanum]
MLTRQDGFRLFLDDGHVDIDSNLVENAIRRPAMNRRNALFAGSDVGATYCSSDDVLKIKGDFEPDPEISDVLIAWHLLRGEQCRLEGRKVE